MKRILSFLLLSVAFINASAQQMPPNYYDAANGLTGSALKSALKIIIENGHTDNGYNGLWTAYNTTDRDNFYEHDGTVLDIYSENPTGPDPYNFTPGLKKCGNYASEGDCYNREHIIPQSLFSEKSPMVADVHFIRPTDGKVNGMRSNYPFGKVGTATFTSQNLSKLGNSVSPGYSGTVFEPIDNFKGDVARMIFYFITRYEDRLSTFTSGGMLGGSSFPGLQAWALKQYMEWHLMDPVSAEEIARNNASFAYQGNRNPFIDNPNYAQLIWGTPVVDNQAPTAPTNLATNTPTSNSISLSWNAATDNIGVTGYDIYVGGTLKTTVSGTTLSTTITGLSPLTPYTFYVIARDAFGNSSPQSNTVAETTLDGPIGTGGCGTEDFNTVPGTDNGYIERNWTNNGITWTATNAKIDESINTTRAITFRNGELTSSSVSGGIKSLTLTTQRKLSGSNGSLNIFINGNNVGSIPYTSAPATITLDNLNISGNIIIKITSTTSNRPTIDDLSWTCYSGSLATSEIKKDKSEFSVYPNPVRNNELFVRGENLNKISKAQIYDLSGKVVETLSNPFQNSNKINLKGLVKGTYILKADQFSTKFIVE